MDTYKNYAVHLGVSFVAAFAAALAAMLKSGAVTPDNIGWTVVGAVLFASFSSALKGVTEGVFIPVAGAVGRATKNVASAVFSGPLEK